MAIKVTKECDKDVTYHIKCEYCGCEFDYQNKYSTHYR